MSKKTEKKELYLWAFEDIQIFAHNEIHAAAMTVEHGDILAASFAGESPLMKLDGAEMTEVLVDSDNPDGPTRKITVKEYCAAVPFARIVYPDL